MADSWPRGPGARLGVPHPPGAVGAPGTPPTIEVDVRQADLPVRAARFAALTTVLPWGIYVVLMLTLFGFNAIWLGFFAFILLVAVALWGGMVLYGRRRQSLLLGPEGIAFEVGDTTKWFAPWTSIGHVQVVDSDGPRRLPTGFLVLEAGPWAVGPHRSLHQHANGTWFALAGVPAGREVDQALATLVPERRVPPVTDLDLPRTLWRR